jgi:hypothetical protein
MQKDLFHGDSGCFLSDFIKTRFESILSVVRYSGHADFSEHETWGEQIPVAWSPGRKKNCTVVAVIWGS